MIMTRVPKLKFRDQVTRNAVFCVSDEMYFIICIEVIFFKRLLALKPQINCDERFPHPDTAFSIELSHLT